MSELEIAVNALMRETARALRELAEEMRKGREEATHLVARAVFAPEHSGLLVACGVVNTSSRPDQILELWLDLGDDSLRVAQKLLPSAPSPELSASCTTWWNPLLPVRAEADAAVLGMLFVPIDKPAEVEGPMRRNDSWRMMKVQAQMLRSEPYRDRIKVYGSWFVGDCRRDSIRW